MCDLWLLYCEASQSMLWDNHYQSCCKKSWFEELSLAIFFEEEEKQTGIAPNYAWHDIGEQNALPNRKTPLHTDNVKNMILNWMYEDLSKVDFSLLILDSGLMVTQNFRTPNIMGNWYPFELKDDCLNTMSIKETAILCMHTSYLSQAPQAVPV